MNTETTPASATMDLTHFDVRVIPCRQKHALIFARWAGLPVGAHFVLVNDHDPVPLYYQFAAQFPGAFNWEYLVEGPDEFQVKITRLTASPAQPAIVPPSKGCGGASADTEVDARGLEPPEPMMRILSAVETLKPGATLRARTDRRPVHLYPELDARGVRYVSEQAADESWITTLSRA
jgi:uncharacterized protein (DUF2249 family)